LLGPQLVRRFIDTATTRGELSALLWLAGLFIVAALAGQALSVGATYAGELVGWRATNALRADLAEHCLELDMAFHDERTPGELIERIDGDVTTLSNFFSRFVVLILGSLLLLVGVLVALFLEDPRVGAALALFSLCALWVLRRVQHVAVPYLVVEREAYAQLHGFLEERLAGIVDLRTSGARAYVLRRFHERARDLFHRGRTAEMKGSVGWLATNALFTLGYALAFGLGIALYRSAAITLGTVYLIWDYTNLLRRPVEELTSQLQELQKATAGIGRIQELLAARSALPEGRGERLPPGATSVEFRDVTFGYGEGEPALRSVSFRLEPGEVLGLVGRTGSGKSTIARLLSRLYDPREGAVLLGGVDARDTSLAELRGRVGLVTQQVQLFGGTVRDNVTLFDPELPDARALGALDEVGLGAWARALPEGLDTRLTGGGAGLSAGESQLLAFARAFLRDPGLVILDEASSRLDPATEARIERAVDRLLEGRTAILIAHRLATVQRAHTVLVLEDGEVAEWGPRERLAADPGSRYSRLLGASREVAVRGE
jgi:ABC-type multidrug transport system fused ATPase/permease subunit